MSYIIKFRELQKEAMKTGLTLDANSIEEMAKKIEEYVNSLPESLRNKYVISLGGRRYRRVDYPMLFRTNPEFRQIFLQMLVVGKK